jgi:Flp pilus assembly protein TadD
VSRAARFVGALLLAIVAGCKGLPERPQASDSYEVAAADPVKVQQIKSDAVRALLEQGQYYAALAHIEEQKQVAPNNAELIWLEAETRRHLQQQVASEALYRRLIGGPLEGKAWHGLGLLTARNDLGAAIDALRNGVRRLPTDVEIRNDLGYALMEAGRYTEALPELSTAAELAPTQLKSRNNLIILMLLTGNQVGAEQIARQSGATPDTLKQLKTQAQAIRSQQASRGYRSPS